MSKHVKHKIHGNSAAAHNNSSDVRSRRKAQVLGAYLSVPRGQPLTDRQVMEKLGFSDMNSVRPVITGFIHARTLKEVGDTICPVTGHRCRLVALLSYKERQGKLFK